MGVKRVKQILCILIILALVALAIALGFPKSLVQKSKLNAENLRASTYGEFKEADSKIDGCNFVEFSAFFTRDLNNDGKAEKIKGTCKDITQKDTLYAEVNVLTQGSLKNGKITLNAENFTWTTAIVEDEIVDGDYIGKTTEINLKEVSNGSQKLLWGSISSNIGNNVNNYSKVSSMTLTGTYVDNNGDEIPISKTIDFTVDWYGKTETKVNRYYYSTNGYNSYDNQKYDIAGTIKDDNIELTFQTAISETSKQLLLNEQVLELEIPELNGYEALDAVVTDKNVEYEYNKETHILKITKKSVTNEKGDITNSISRSNVYNIKLTYPLESYSSMTADSVVLNIKTKGYNYGYNNPNKEFKNPYESTAEGIITVTFSNPSGDVWNIYPYVGKYTYNNNLKTYKYQISKENVVNIYNGNKDEDIKDIYPVSWQVVIGDYEKVKTIILEEEKSDEFLNTDGNYESMTDYVTTTGVYFSNADQMLKEDGWIRLYDGKTGEVVKEFRNDTWNKYTQGKPYEVNLKSIKIETSSPKASGTLNVYQIKELNDDLIVERFSEEEFEKISYIYTNLKGSITLADDVVSEDSTIITKGAFANYDMIHSAVNITMNPDAITNQETKNVDIKIQTLSGSEFERKWTNGVFLVELPEEIIGLDVQSVKSSDSSVKIISNQVFEQDGKQFIKIYTSNEKEATYTLTINADITANPLISTTNKEIKLYSYNENGDNYYNKTQDVYDIDSDGNTTDYIGLNSDLITIVAPSGLLTTEYVTNYDDLESRTIAPNIADIEKADERRTATINVNLTNNYSGTISDVRILGKIPFEGNTAILNDINLNSQFTANMKSGIIVPENLKNYVNVYYSSNENPTNELDNVANGWNKAEQITDWNAVRSYLIDFENYKLAKDENNVFTYEVEVPAGLGYNSVSYSNHAVYYNLDTENGKLATRTEPNKVGIQVVAKYGLELTKNQLAHDDILVKGATYSITTLDQEGKEISKTATTNENGVLKFSGLYVEREYTLREVASPSDYELNDDEIKFVGKINDNNFDIEISESSEGSFKEKSEITTDEKGNYLVKAKVEDEVRYTLKINKTNEKGEILPGTRFSIVGKGKNTRYKTDKKGTIRIPGLYLGEEYVLTEVESEGYYVEGTSSKFTITRDADGILGIKTEDITLDGKVITENSILANAVITENTQNIQPQVEVTISNEKIPTYNLQIIKVEQNYNENDIEKLKKLEKATFRLEGEELKDSIVETTNENGMIEISDLYLYIESKKDIVSGEYTIQETNAPSGYSNNAEEIRFKTSMNSDGKLQVEVINENEVTTLKQVIVEENTIKLVIEDRPLFKLTKIDSETGLPLANAKFMIKEVDSTGKEGDFAKDVNENYVGEQDELGQWIVTTDENGIIMLPLKGGSYKSIEVGFPDGYQENDIEEFFKIAETGNDEEEEPKPEEPEEPKEDEEEPEYTEIVKIGTKDELIDFANRVNGTGEYEGKAESFDGKKVILTNDIKLNEDNIADEQKENFIPIGIDHDHAFKGTFDGEGHEISNIYINSSNQYVGVFGLIENGKIRDVKVNGKVIANTGVVGGIVGQLGCTGDNSVSIINCKSRVEIISTSSCTGGIAGQAGGMVDINIIGCENSGKISNSGNTGGIIGSAGCSRNINISNCKNSEEISSSSSSTGGIIGNATCAKNINISNCYNKGAILGSGYAGGIAGYVNCGGNIDISNCKNEREISSNSKSRSSYAGGIVGYAYSPSSSSSINISECENGGEINSNSESKESYAGGMVGYASSGNDRTISNCENVGEVSSTSNSASSYAGGIVGYVSGGENSNISNCENKGYISSNGEFSSSYTGGIVGFGYSYRLNIINCINVGNTRWSINNTSYVGLILGYETCGSVNLNNNYYLDSIQIEGTNINTEGIAISDEDMKSIEFYNALNVDNVWEYRAGKYPVLMKPLSENIVDSTEIIIQNTIKKYQITAEPLPIEGGTISFEKSDVSDGDSEGANEEDKSSETVKIYENSTKNIVISPAEGYGISDITVNEKSIDYVLDENGKVTLSAKTEEFLRDIQENKHIVVKFDKIENIKPRLSVIVHHYLKDSEGNYTTIKIAKDDIYKGYADEFYSTEPHTDLEKLTLEKDTKGKFVIPNNASGKYTQESIEIMYYYEAEPIELKIHHYLNGTQNKLVQDDIIYINPEVRFDENGNYEVVCEESYSLADNEKYNNLIKQYNLVNLSTTVQENVEISDTIKYNTDSELSYYYELKEYTITTKVELHPELRTDGLTNEKVELLVDGGTISGNGQDKYEVVVRGENSSKEIVITPYEGYTIEKVTLNSINDAGEKTTTILYGENRAIDAEVTCIENEDGSMSLISANSSSDSLFQNVVENKEIIVKLAPKVGTIIVHHYFEGTGEEYNTLPERIILLDGTICNDEVKKEIIGENYATKAYTRSEVMYELVSTSGETNGKVTDGEKHVYYYYKRLEQKITTEVIKHEEIDEAGNTVLVKGGSISGENESPYEKVLKFDDSTKEIKIIPEETYQIKKVLVNGEEISLDKILDDKSLILDKFESVDKDIHVAVEFEKIPTKVIIKYIDEETGKEISKQDIIEGIINTSYETNSKQIEGYELLENKLPENAKGIMTEDDIIVIYYYKKVKAPVEEPTKEPTEKPTEDKPTENPNKPENEPKEEEPGKDYETPERKEEEKTTTPEIQNQSNLPKVLIKTGQSRAMVIGLVIIITSSIIVIIVINKKQK